MDLTKLSRLFYPFIKAIYLVQANIQPNIIIDLKYTFSMCDKIRRWMSNYFIKWIEQFSHNLFSFLIIGILEYISNMATNNIE